MKANQAVVKTEGSVELSLPSFRGGVSFAAKDPDVDGFVHIIDSLEGPKGVLMKIISFEVLKRKFEDVTLEEVGKMDFSDVIPLIKIGFAAVNRLDDLGFQEISEVPK